MSILTLAQQTESMTYLKS